jgi:hypothetical protein
VCSRAVRRAATNLIVYPAVYPSEFFPICSLREIFNMLRHKRKHNLLTAGCPLYP